jgi:hypothetical protein
MNGSLDPHQAELLRRLDEAEALAREKGEERQPFLLIYASVGSVGIKHPGWDWDELRPTAQDIDDLEELGLVRNETAGNVKRVFSLTVHGRRQAEALKKPSTVSRGRAPALDETLRWLVELDQESPEHLATPASLPAKAVESRLIEPGSEEMFAQRILDLLAEGFLVGNAPGIEQGGALVNLQFSDGLRLTMRAHERAEEKKSSASLNFYSSVVGSQIAGGNINNFVSFGDLLDRAEAEIKSLEGVVDEDRDSALRLIETLRGKAAEVSTGVLSGAGGGLLAGVLAQLTGLPVA